jgi:methionyl-tRNA synthetase
VNFHGLFWPAVLQGSGLRTPTRLHVNGYLTVDGAKMSKSRGTFVMAKTYVDAGLPPEALRYYYATKSSGGVDDLDLNLSDFVARVNSDIVGKFVNIASRCAGFIDKHFDGVLGNTMDHEPTVIVGGPYDLESRHPTGKQLYLNTLGLRNDIQSAYEHNDPANALRMIMRACDHANAYVAIERPWQLAKQLDTPDTTERLHAVCTAALNIFRLLAIYLKPVLPNVATQAETFLAAPLAHWSDLDAPLLGHAIQPYTALFTRIDPKQIDAMTEASKDTMTPTAAPAGGASAPNASSAKKLVAEAAATKSEAPKTETAKSEYIGIDDFAKLDLRIGKVLACEFVEGSDKLLRFELDAGELGKRQIFSGIRGSYGEPEKLVGRSVVFIANLAPRKMRFGVSEGMILSAGFDGGALALLDADSGAAPGMPVR